ncbi:MAG: hypothetical protein SPL67_01470 [Prevotella sp.]|nr:hypothetical protein [Prevotella sp.]
MKRLYFCKARTLLSKSVLSLCLLMMVALTAKAQDATTTYNFKSLPAIDSLLFAGDTDNWTLVTESTSKYFTNKTELGKYHGEKDADADINDFKKYFFKLNIDGSEPQTYAGLWFGKYYVTGAGHRAFGTFPAGKNQLRFYTNRLGLWSGGAAFAIDNLKKGQTVEIVTRSAKTGNYLVPSNLDITDGFAEITSAQINKDVTSSGTVVEDGACVFYATNGIYVYTITLKDAEGTVVTAIDAPALARAAKAAPMRVYNLQGQRVADSAANLPNGLYIVNGKKVVKK